MKAGAAGGKGCSCTGLVSGILGAFGLGKKKVPDPARCPRCTRPLAESVLCQNCRSIDDAKSCAIPDSIHGPALAALDIAGALGAEPQAFDLLVTRTYQCIREARPAHALDEGKPHLESASSDPNAGKDSPVEEVWHVMRASDYAKLAGLLAKMRNPRKKSSKLAGNARGILQSAIEVRQADNPDTKVVGIPPEKTEPHGGFV